MVDVLQTPLSPQQWHISPANGCIQNNVLYSNRRDLSQSEANAWLRQTGSTVLWGIPQPPTLGAHPQFKVILPCRTQVKRCSWVKKRFEFSPLQTTFTCTPPSRLLQTPGTYGIMFPSLSSYLFEKGEKKREETDSQSYIWTHCMGKSFQPICHT